MKHAGQFQREHRTNTSLPEDPFTPEQKQVVLAAIQQLDNKLKACGKETLPTHLYQFYTGTTLSL
jgi:predicted DNA-binding transcriptional regulator YafY